METADKTEIRETPLEPAKRALQPETAKLPGERNLLSVKLREWATTPLVWFLAGLLLLFLVSIGLFLRIYNNFEPQPTRDLDFELARSLLQVGVVSVSAAVVSILVFNYQRQRDERLRLQRQEADDCRRNSELIDELLIGTLTRVTASYLSTKRARRTLRALGRYQSAEGEMVRIPVYAEWMARLNDAQLELEAVVSDVRTSLGIYPSARKLLRCLRTMENYLRKLTREYEKQGWRVADCKDVPLVEMTRLADFIGPAGERKFQTRFAEQYEVLGGAIRDSLIHARFGIAREADKAETTSS
jgi:hypothetical protein